MGGGDKKSAAAVSIHAPAWGATKDRCALGAAGKVSIHAPAWGATIARVEKAHECAVSIHAPAWGATGGDEKNTFSLESFNPRARVGRDRVTMTVASRPVSFNPRARVGRDTINIDTYHKPEVFQSTRPRGARLSSRYRK